MVRSVESPGFAAGDHLRVRRRKGIYTHHGLYLGDNRVVEFGGDICRKRDAIVREVSLSEFQDETPAEVVAHDHPPLLARWMPTALPRQERVERARFLVGTAIPGRYNLIGHNCEHVATWCVVGFPESAQVRLGLYVNLAVGLALAVFVTSAVRARRPLPVIPLLTIILGRLWLVGQYHIHAGRFVREIDRTWQTRAA